MHFICFQNKCIFTQHTNRTRKQRPINRIDIAINTSKFTSMPNLMYVYKTSKSNICCTYLVSSQNKNTHCNLLNTIACQYNSLNSKILKTLNVGILLITPKHTHTLNAKLFHITIMLSISSCVCSFRRYTYFC